MPCSCGEVTCICFYVCACRPQLCFCQACIVLRDPTQQSKVENHSKQNNVHKSPSKSPRKRAQSDRANEQMSSVANDSPAGPSRIQQGASPVFDQRRQTPGHTPNTNASNSSPNNDPYPTLRRHLSTPPRYWNHDRHSILRKRLSETAPPQNNDQHAILRRHLSQPAPPSNNDSPGALKRQLSQPTPPSNSDPYAILRRRLSEPRKIPIGGNLFPELTPSSFRENPSNTDSSSSSSASNKDPYLPSTNKTGGCETPSTSGFNSSNSTNSSENAPTTPSDSNDSNLEYLKKASDKALPSYESFSSRFSTLSCDENNNSGITAPTSQNQDTRQITTDISDGCSEIPTPFYPGTSGASSSPCINPESQSLHPPDRARLQPSPQEQPLNLSLVTGDNPKNSNLHSSELPPRSPPPVPAKQQRMDTIESSNVPTGKGDYRSADFFREGLSARFTKSQIFPSSNSIAKGSFSNTRSEPIASTSKRSPYTSCIVQNPSHSTARTEQYDSPMDTEESARNFDQNVTGDSLSVPSTSGVLPSCPASDSSSQALSESTVIYCNDMNDGRNFTLRTTSLDLHNLEDIQTSQSAFSASNRFSETSENPFLGRESFSIRREQTSANRKSVIKYQPSRSTSEFSGSEATNPVLSDVEHHSSRTSNEGPITPQHSDFSLSMSDLNMDAASSTAPPIESTESNTRDQEHLPRSQSSTLQSASSEINISQRTAHSKDDETGENNQAK